MRGDLAQVLCEAVEGDIPIRLGTTITHLRQHPDCVQVAFSDGNQQSYDLVIGSDGVHSKVRELIWGSENQFENYLGYYVSCAIIENFLDQTDAFFTHLESERQAAVYAIRGDRLATFFIFQSPPLHLNGRSTQFDAIETRFGEIEWIVPELLTKMKTAEHFYFDTVSQIKVEQWHQGRVALVGEVERAVRGGGQSADRAHGHTGRERPESQAADVVLQPAQVRIGDVDLDAVGLVLPVRIADARDRRCHGSGKLGVVDA
jgi:2-polyprenyl-6-methoxyphenol hydroxylase-like FAD-dependent oxidoreductase